MQNKLKILFIASMLLTTVISPGYTQKIHGEVMTMDEKGNHTGLPGANVYWSGTSNGTSTDATGHFEIRRPAGGNSLLVASFLGYKNDTITLKPGDKDIMFMLSPNSIDLNAVQITDNPNSSYFSKVNPVNTQIITSKELVKAACCNLSESFENNATVDVAYSDAISGAKQIEMLGLAGIYSQIQFENIPAIRGLASVYGLSYVPGPWMESIQVSKGTSTVKNGFESVTGQINVEYKKPETSEKFFANLFLNDLGRTELNFNTKLKVSKKWNTMLLAHGEYFGNKSDRNKDGFIDLPLIQQYNLMNRWKYSGTKGFDAIIGLKVLQEQRTGGQMNFVKSRDYGDTFQYGIGVNTFRAELFAKTGYVFPKKQYSSIGLINSLVYHNQKSFFGLNTYDATQYSYYGNLIYQSIFKNTNHKYVTGLSMIYDSYDEKFKDSVSNRVESIPGAFFEYTYELPEKITIMLGIRGDYHNDYGFFYTPRIHLRYKINSKTILRASAGKGYRMPNTFAESASLLATSKKIKIKGDLKPEEAWNYGIFFSRDFLIEKNKITFNIDFYRTDFINQVITDMDYKIQEIHIYNLNGKSYSNSVQAELRFKAAKHFEATLAYRYNDVKSTYHKQLLSKPMVKRDKALLTLSYYTKYDKWQFDYTLQYNGQSRLHGLTPDQPYEYSPDYFIMNAQITKRFKKWEIYVGGENLTNYTQKVTILGADKPFGADFDATRIWGPITGTRIYGGLRFILK